MIFRQDFRNKVVGVSKKGSRSQVDSLVTNLANKA